MERRGEAAFAPVAVAQSGMDSASSPAFARHAEAVRQRLAASGLLRAGAGSVTWKINREIVVVAGWGRAILLQLAHPLVAAGVAEHSAFRGSPLATVQRLAGTIGAMLSMTFGDDEEMIVAAAGINVIHDRVFGKLHTAAGPFSEGTPYSAHQAELLRWVHVTLLDSLPLVYEHLVGPLTRAEKDRYCAEGATMEPLLGIPAGLLPRSINDLESYTSGMLAGGAIAVSDNARRVARAVLSPPWSGVLWPAFRPMRLLTIGLLPAPVREAYGFRWGAREERALRRWVFALRIIRQVLPTPFREWPAARLKLTSRLSSLVARHRAHQYRSGGRLDT